jgi:hypothetical protein
MADETDRSGKKTGNKVLSPEFTRRTWQPGQSGNPGGRPSLREHRAEARNIISRGGLRRAAELARLSDKDFDKDGILKPLPKSADGGTILAAIKWLDLVGYGPPQSFGPPEEPSRPWGEFRPELLTEAQRQFVKRAIELIRQASVQPGVVEEVRKP